MTGYLLIGGGVLILIGMIAFQFRGAFGGLASLVTRKATVPVIDSDAEDAKDMAALKRLKARFAKLGCKDGQAAMVTVAHHFFHEGAHE
jgi:hypothetical protein